MVWAGRRRPAQTMYSLTDKRTKTALRGRFSCVYPSVNVIGVTSGGRQLGDAAQGNLAANLGQRHNHKSGHLHHPTHNGQCHRPGEFTPLSRYERCIRRFDICKIGSYLAPVAERISFIGSIKWRDDQLFDYRDYHQLSQAALSVPGVTPDTHLVALSRQGHTADTPPITHFGPEDLVNAWR